VSLGGRFVAGAILLATLSLSCGGTDHSARVEEHKRLAGELQNNRLYEAAVDEYLKILAYDDVSSAERGNVCYLIGRIYYRDLSDYENAAAYYVRAKEYDPQGSFVAGASKNLVACLERLGNIADARRQLDRATNIERGPAGESDVVVAKLGDREIWLSEIDERLAQLPADVQKRFLAPEAKRQFVRQYVGAELIYNAAVREDYLSDPKVQKERDQLVKSLVVERYVTEKVMPELKIDTMDVRNFYEAGKESRYKGAAYDSVRAQVFLDYQSEKAEAAYNDYISRLAHAENVEFFDARVK